MKRWLLGEHSCEVELGRFRRVARSERVCVVCKIGEAADEVRVLSSRCLRCKDDKAKVAIFLKFVFAKYDGIDVSILICVHQWC